MKKIIAAFVIASTVVACSNQDNTKEDTMNQDSVARTGTDTSLTTQGGAASTSGSGAGDTASFERMRNQTDTLPKR